MNKFRSMGPSEWLLLVTLSVLWGGSFFFSKVALYELPPFTVVLARVSIAAVTLNFVAIVTGHRMPFSMKIWGAFIRLRMQHRNERRQRPPEDYII
jgi:drug/metabolite transporter (DMT)-like permease